MSRHEGPTHTSAPPKLPAMLRLGAVHLTVSDLDRSVAFYEDAIGLRLHHREDGVAAMGVGEEDLLVLYEERGARRAGRHAGIYHYALLFPSREELAHAATQAAASLASSSTETGVAACSAFVRSPLSAACSPTLVSIVVAPPVAHAGHRGGPVSHVSDGVILLRPFMTAALRRPRPPLNQCRRWWGKTITSEGAKERLDEIAARER